MPVKRATITHFAIPKINLQLQVLNSPVRLNLGGTVYTATWRLMGQHAATRLGRLAAAASVEEALGHCDGYNPGRNEFFFNRRSRNFGEILDFYRNGALHIRNIIIGY